MSIAAAKILLCLINFDSIKKAALIFFNIDLIFLETFTFRYICYIIINNYQEYN